MSTMKDIAKIVAERNGMARYDAEQFVAAFFDQLKIGLSNDELVKVKGLGTFKIQTMRQRASVNVNTGERVLIDSHDRISFTPDKAMADAVNRPFAHFDTVIINDGVVFDDIDNIPAETESQPEPPVVEVSNAVDEPSVIEEPVDVEEPKVIEEPVAVEEPKVIEEPVAKEEPPLKEEPVAPVISKEPIVIQESVVVNGSIVLNGPVVLNDKIQDSSLGTAKTEEQEKPVGPEPPVTPIVIVSQDMPEDEDGMTAESQTSDDADSLSDENDSNNDVSQQNTSDMIFGKKNVDKEGDEYNETPNYSPSEGDIERKDRWYFRVILCAAILILGFAVGRITADYTFDDLLVAIHVKDKKVTPIADETTIVYTGEKEHEIQAAQDSVIADSLEKAAENRIVTKARQAVEERIEQKKQALAAGKKAAQHDAEIKSQAEKKVAEAKAEAAKKAAADKAAAEKAAAEKAAAEKAAAEKAAAQKSTASDAYNNDPRIRYGAYKIVGVAKTVTVKEGQTLASISKTYLGPGMECYVEAINGVKQVSAGQKVKIPELKLKKAAK